MAQPEYNVEVPSVRKMPCEMKVGRVVRIMGVVRTDADKFSINFLDGQNTLEDNKALHFNPRFPKEKPWLKSLWNRVASEDQCLDSYVARNTFEKMKWGHVEEKDGGNPFQRGEEFEIRILCGTSGYEIDVNGKRFTVYNHRLRYQEVKYISFHGDVSIASLSYDETPQSVEDSSPDPTPALTSTTPLAQDAPYDQDEPSTSEPECVVCFSNPREVVCLPCGHIGICRSCSEQLLQHHGGNQRGGPPCPMCRNPVASFTQVFQA